MNANLDRLHATEAIWTPVLTAVSTAPPMPDDGCYWCGETDGVTTIEGTRVLVCIGCYAEALTAAN